MLIVAPLRVCHMVWPAEIAKWAEFNGLTYTILHGDDKDDKLKEKVDIYIINPDGLPWLVASDGFKKLKIDRLVVDESSYFKHTKTKRFKLLKPALRQMRSRWILTGSPAANGYLDLFGQVYIMDAGAALGAYITHYKNQFFYPSGFGGYTYLLQPGADKRIQEKLKPYIRRLDADDLLQLPDVVMCPIYVDLPPAARKVYKQMDVLMMAELESKEMITAETAAAASIKCRQIANGGLYRAERDNVAIESDGWVDIHIAKAEAVEELLEGLQGQPAMVAYEFNHDLARLKKQLGKATPHIGGGVPIKASIALGTAWNAKQLPTLLVQPASVAHGLNLQGGGNHLIWHSLTFNWEHWDQLIRRLRRQGSKYKQIFVYPIIARKTVDEWMFETCMKKGAVERKFLDSLK